MELHAFGQIRRQALTDHVYFVKFTNIQVARTEHSPEAHCE